MIILAIESSCDEFSVAIARDNQILCNIVSSQIADHTVYGGVVPELAARLHVSNFSWVVSAALEEANVGLHDITHIAYTEKPGLIGSLIIGSLVAKTLAQYLDIPLLGVNHLEGHIYAATINHTFTYPVLSLVVSGGHTQLVYLPQPLQFNIIGTTQDDAIGECYDKVARVLGLGYPGGPKIDVLAHKGDATKYNLLMPKNDETLDFSFSGLKTAAINLITKCKNKQSEIDVPSFCASFQKTAILSVISKLKKTLSLYPNTKCVSIAGGVSANSELRMQLQALQQSHNVDVIIPSMEYCTDNGAMIAAVAYQYLK